MVIRVSRVNLKSPGNIGETAMYAVTTLHGLELANSTAIYNAVVVDSGTLC